MGLLGQILGSVLAQSQSQPQSQGPAQPQQAHDMLTSILNLIHSPNIGGIGGLVALLQQKGLGNLVNGWVNNGPNPPISPSQLLSALGPDRIQQFAQQNGMSQTDATNALSQLLPHVVDHLTPNGAIPAQATNMDSMLASLKSQLA